MPIGIVAIGRNEGERLKSSLTAAVAVRDAVVVYVDSGSTDGSAAWARSIGVNVVDLDMSKPFTAARARNEGFAELMKQRPGVEFVQFIDGDCELQPGWIEKALAEFASKPKAAVICGRRRERYPEASPYNRLCDIEWNTPVGQAKACGGDAMFRTVAFQAVGGFNPDIIAGEEPELCVRLRQAGWEIWRIDAEMTLHDAAMTRFGQWWKRNVRAGHAFAEGFDRHGAPPEEHWKREYEGNQKWGPLWLIPLVWPMFGLLALKITRDRMRQRQPMGESLLYGTFTALGKLPQWLGQRKYCQNKRSGRREKLIEYKGPAARTA